MKRAIAITLTLIIVLSLSSCGGKKSLASTWQLTDKGDNKRHIGDQFILSDNGRVYDKDDIIRVIINTWHDMVSWEVNGDMIIFTDDYSHCYYFKYQLSGGELRLCEDGSNYWYVFRRVS